MKIQSILFGIFIFILLTLIYGCSGPWKGKVIDVETKEPVEGAVVMAVWDRVYRTPMGTNNYFYEAKETLTNKDGEYEIPSYTPINILPIISYMSGPFFTIYKPGYGSIQGLDLEHIFINTTKGKMEWKERDKGFAISPGIVELPKLKTIEERKSFTGPSPQGHDKDYKKQKLLINYLREEHKFLFPTSTGTLYGTEQ